jgi:hypothetical protein
MRWIFGTGVLLLGASFVACRARWTRYFAATSPPGTATWIPRMFPYMFFSANVVCAVVIYSGLAGAK